MKIKDSFSDKVFLISVYVFLWFCLIIVLYPLIYIVSASFSSPRDVVSGKVWLWPINITLMGYEAVFKHGQIVSGFYNSFLYTFVGTCVNLVLTVMAAFPLSRKELYGRNIIMGIFVFTLLFSGGLIPTYILVNKLGLINTRWAMILPTAMSVWNVLITKTYYQTNLPDEMYEAAVLDGCDDIRYLLQIVVPLSGPILAVMALYYGVGHWNSYFNAMIFLKSSGLYPLQLVLRNILILNNLDMNMIKDADVLLRLQGLKDLLKYSVIVVSSVPMLCIYPFVQKYFVKGVMLGALKG